MKNILLYLYIIFTCLFFFGCEKDNETFIPLPDNVKNYVFFLPNSKWVFQDDSTLVRDTITVTSSSITKKCYQRDNDVNCWADMKIEYFSSLSNNSFLDQSAYDYPKEVYRSKITPNSNVFGPSDTSPYYIYSEQYFNSMMFNGQTYQNVYKFHYENKVIAGTTGYIAYDFYWALNIGNIKKVFYKDDQVESWSLIYSNVHQ